MYAPFVQNIFDGDDTESQAKRLLAVGGAGAGGVGNPVAVGVHFWRPRHRRPGRRRRRSRSVGAVGTVVCTRGTVVVDTLVRVVVVVVVALVVADVVYGGCCKGVGGGGSGGTADRREGGREGGIAFC